MSFSTLPLNNSLTAPCRCRSAPERQPPAPQTARTVEPLLGWRQLLQAGRPPLFQCPLQVLPLPVHQHLEERRPAALAAPRCCCPPHWPAERGPQRRPTPAVPAVPAGWRLHLACVPLDGSKAPATAQPGRTDGGRRAHTAPCSLQRRAARILSKAACSHSLAAKVKVSEAGAWVYIQPAASAPAHSGLLLMAAHLCSSGAACCSMQ